MPRTLSRADDRTLNYAMEELERWLLPRFPHTADWHCSLATDDTLPPFQWSVTVAGPHIDIRGHDSACVLHGVYDLLAQAGYVFDVTGPWLRADAATASIDGYRSQGCPAVLWRGIRQHLNFPMDISSYPLAEARDYLRQLARMGFNHITFHSYPDQWYAVTHEGHTRHAGHYFYGQRYDLPDHPLRTVIRNQHTFCIPEHEAGLDDVAANSERAQQWLGALLDEASRLGLRVQFSCELREQNLALSLATLHSLLATYPQIAVLEIITQEMGAWGQAAPPETLRDLAAQYFPGALADPVIMGYLAQPQPDLDRLLREIGHGLEVLAALRAAPAPVPLPALALGVYCTVPANHALMLRLLQQYAPPELTFTFLLDHGGRAVARNLHALHLTPADWSRSLLYSWIEFDGTLYLLQNAVQGIARLLELAAAVHGTAPIPALAFNHWRTAENRTCLRYTAHSLLAGPTSPADFYRHDAAALGLADAGPYAAAMTLIDDAEAQARDDLPNVGFCYVGCWGDQGLGYYGIFQADKARSVRARYAAAHHRLAECLPAAATATARAHLALLLNRLHCTIVYLEAIEIAAELPLLIGERPPAALPEAERAAVVAICDRALRRMEDYMALHAQHLPDRGAEGTLISFYHTPPAVLRRIRAEYSGAAAPARRTTHDAPPSPIWTGLLS